MSDFEEIGALWLKESKKGTKFMSGNVKSPNGEKFNITVFKNTRKQPGERFPDYKIFLGMDYGKKETPIAQSDSQEPAPDDDCPF